MRRLLLFLITAVTFVAALPVVFGSEHAPADAPAIAIEYLTENEILEEIWSHRVFRCVYVKHFEVKPYRDPEIMVYINVTVDAGIFPLLDRLPNGAVKTVFQISSGTPEKMYEVSYFRAEDITADWRETEWFRRFGDYDIDPAAPKFCTIPKRKSLPRSWPTLWPELAR